LTSTDLGANSDVGWRFRSIRRLVSKSEDLHGSRASKLYTTRLAPTPHDHPERNYQVRNNAGQKHRLRGMTHVAQRGDDVIVEFESFEFFCVGNP
jgi:hypothetical protein